MNNYCELPAPNITGFFYDLIIESYWRISGALINLAGKTSPQRPAAMMRACPESVWGSQLRGTKPVTASPHPVTVPYHTPEGHNFFRELSKGLIYAGNTTISSILWGLGLERDGVRLGPPSVHAPLKQTWSHQIFGRVLLPTSEGQKTQGHPVPSARARVFQDSDIKDTNEDI